MGVLSLAEIMDQAIYLLKKHMKNIVLFNLIYGLIYGAASIFILILGSMAIALLFVIKINSIIIYSGIVLLIILMSALFLISKIGLIKISSQDFTGEVVDFGKALGESFKSIFKVLGLVGIMVIGLLPIVGIFGTIIYFLLKGFGLSVMLVNSISGKALFILLFAIVVYLIGFIAISLYLTLFCFSFQALASEGLGIISALKRSFSLVKGNFWGIFGVNILINITVYAIKASFSSLTTLLIALLYFLFKVLNAPTDFLIFFDMGMSMLNWPIAILSMLIINPISTIMMTLLYYNQRFRREGLDILLKLKEVEKNKERKQTSESTYFNNTI